MIDRVLFLLGGLVALGAAYIVVATDFSDPEDDDDWEDDEDE